MQAQHELMGDWLSWEWSGQVAETLRQGTSELTGVSCGSNVGCWGMPTESG